MAKKGVNLGGWLVLERWITPSLFEGTDAQDEFSLSSSGEKYQRAIDHHYATYITEKDIIQLKDQGITHLRIPIGYWIFGDYPPFNSGLEYLDWLFNWAEKYEMNVLLSIHAAPGSQNGKHHSGKIGEVTWRDQRRSLQAFTKRIVERYKARKCLWGVGLLNEPQPHSNNLFALLYYYTATTWWIKRKAPHIRLYLDGTFNPKRWVFVAALLNIGVDFHFYHGFGGANHTVAQQNLHQNRIFLQKIKRLVPFIIGEWSGVISKRPTPEVSWQYIADQEAAYSISDAHFYWTYKTEGGGSWSFKDMSKM